MEKEIELLSCPFCEGSAELRNDVDEYWYVSCNECINQTTHFFNGKDVVIARWNTRSREARLVERIENLRSVIAEAIRLTHETWTANGLSKVLLADTETALADINPNGDEK